MMFKLCTSCVTNSFFAVHTSHMNGSLSKKFILVQGIFATQANIWSLKLKSLLKRYFSLQSQIFGHIGYSPLHFFAKAITHPPAQLASIVVQPYHVAHNLRPLFIKINNGANIFSVKFCLHYTEKYYAVRLSDTSYCNFVTWINVTYCILVFLTIWCLCKIIWNCHKVPF